MAAVTVLSKECLAEQAERSDPRYGVSLGRSECAEDPR